MIQGPLSEMIHNLGEGALPWELVEDAECITAWIDVGEAILMGGTHDNWGLFLERAPVPAQLFLQHLTRQNLKTSHIDLEQLLEQVRTAAFRSPVLEARIRLEQAVIDAAEGRIELALERSEWAEQFIKRTMTDWSSLRFERQTALRS